MIPLLVIYLLPYQSFAQVSLSNNVVAITTTYPQTEQFDEKTEYGFGFITGQSGDYLYVTTAKHVITELKREGSIKVRFHRQSSTVTATKEEIRSNGVDIAVLKVRMPGWKWKKNSLGIVRLRDQVGYIGKKQKWYNPGNNLSGKVTGMGRNEIVLDDNSVTSGCSGGPLISRSGIVGLIITDDSDEITALNLGRIKDILSRYDNLFLLTLGAIHDRDNNYYPVKKMKTGNLWMTENLNTRVEDSWCYETDDNNCLKYGRLYTWQAAKDACRLIGEGWHLPFDQEWKELAVEYGGYYDNKEGRLNGRSAKQGYAALRPGGKSGFNAIFGGYFAPNDGYLSSYLNNTGYYWTATALSSKNNYYVNYNLGKDTKTLSRSNNISSIAFSVRCASDTK